jgi:toxin ParE1/3/4
MSVPIYKRPPARPDLVDVFDYYARQGAVITARRFLIPAEATMKRLAGMLGIGTRYQPNEPLFGELRYLPESRFPA